MKHKQFKMSIVLILGLGLTAVQPKAQNMNIKVTSGISTAFVINETQKLTFNEGNLVVTKKDGATTSFPI